jgi:beta-ureidopropionase
MRACVFGYMVVCCIGFAPGIIGPPTVLAESPGKAAQRDVVATSSVRFAGIVLKWVRGDREENMRRLVPLIREAAAGGAKIVCTTECFLDGYAIADKSIPLEVYQSYGEPIPGGKFYRQLADLSRELKIHLVAGIHEVEDDKHYNTAVLIGPDGALLGKYHKQKLEHELVRNEPGNQCPTFSTPYGRVGLMICADRREATIVRGLCEAGADFLICPSGGMFGPKSNDPIVQGRSRESGRYILFVHPAEFLVTAPDGSNASCTLLGTKLLTQTGSPDDLNRVFYFNLPLGELTSTSHSATRAKE